MAICGVSYELLGVALGAGACLPVHARAVQIVHTTQTMQHETLHSFSKTWVGDRIGQLRGHKAIIGLSCGLALPA
jgi:hypothetical protein